MQINNKKHFLQKDIKHINKSKLKTKKEMQGPKECHKTYQN